MKIQQQILNKITTENKKRITELENKYNTLHNRLNKIVDYIETTLTESFNRQIEAIAKYVDTKLKTINKKTTIRKK